MDKYSLINPTIDSDLNKAAILRVCTCFLSSSVLLLIKNVTTATKPQGVHLLNFSSLVTDDISVIPLLPLATFKRRQKQLFTS